jgi:hypothetical protein
VAALVYPEVAVAILDVGLGRAGRGHGFFSCAIRNGVRGAIGAHGADERLVNVLLALMRWRCLVCWRRQKPVVQYSVYKSSNVRSGMR